MKIQAIKLNTYQLKQTTPLTKTQPNFKGAFKNDSALENLSKDSQTYWQRFIYACFGQTYENPVTKKYDKNIYDYEQELIKKRFFHTIPTAYAVAIASIDEKTGELSPIAQRLIDCIIAPTKMEASYPFAKEIKEFKEDKFLYHHNTEDMPLLIQGLKDKYGHFSKKNLEITEEILRCQMYEFGEFDWKFSAEILNAVKNKHGIAEKIYLDKALSMYDLGGDVIRRNLKALKHFPEDKQEEIYNFCTNLYGSERHNLHNFAPTALFCFDKNGKPRQQKIELLKEIAKREQFRFFESKSFFELCYRNKDLKELYFASDEDSNYEITFNNVIRYMKPDGSLPAHVKEKMKDFITHTGESNYFDDIYTACEKAGDGKAFHFNEEWFNNFLTLVDLSKEIGYKETNLNLFHIANNTIGTKYFTINRKVEVYEEIEKMIELIETKYPEKSFNEIYEARKKFRTDLFPIDKALPISKEDKINAIQNIFKVGDKQEALTEFETTLINSMDLLNEYSTDGLPIKYPRQEFLKDLQKICKQNPEAEEIIKTKLNIDIKKGANDRFTGYNNLISITDLNKNNELEKEIYDCCNKFLYENEVQTEDENLNKYLNYIIKAFPEFINLIGKKQHSMHIYSVDIHSLLVLADCFKNNAYKNDLNKEDKITLITTALLHDIGKQEREVDKLHPQTSARLSLGILSKIFPDKAFINRVFNLISGHDFLEEMTSSKKEWETAKKFAFLFRRPNDLQIAKILTEADLKAVNEDFYDMFGPQLNSDRVNDVDLNITYYNSNGNAVFTTPIIYPKRAEKKCKTRINGKDYTVIDLHKIKANENLGEYGFKEGLKKKDLRFLVHMTNNFETLNILSDSTKENLLSETIISPSMTGTYGYKDYGVFLSQKNYDTINMSWKNQGSGTEKSLERDIDLIFSDEERNNFKKHLLKELKIEFATTFEFADFYRDVLSKKTSINQIDSKEIFYIGKHKFTGNQLKKAIISFQNTLLRQEDDGHNEIVGYKPEIKGVIAKVTRAEDINQSVLDFAYKHNYPIVMI